MMRLVETFFPTLVGREGINAIALVDTRGHLVDFWNSPKFRSEILQEISENFVQIGRLSWQLETEMDELVVPFEKGILYLRVEEKFLLLIIARSNLDITLLRLLVNVELDRFLADKKVKKLIKKWPPWEKLSPTTLGLDEMEREFLRKILEGEHG